MAAQPWNKLIEVELVRIIKGEDENGGLLGIRQEAYTIDGEESVHGGESGPLVAVDKWMVLCKALPKSGGFFDKVCVITGLRSEESCFKNAWISHAVGAAVVLNLICMYGQNFRCGEVIGHSANFL